MSETAEISWKNDNYTFVIAISDDPIKHAELNIFSAKTGDLPVVSTVLPAWIIKAVASVLDE